MRARSITRREFVQTLAAAGVAGAALGWRPSETVLAAAMKRGGTLTVGIGTDLTSLDPNDNVFANNPMYYQIYNYLIMFSETLHPRPDLAEYWELAPDGMSALFRLRTGVATHSGGTFGADALIANFRRVKEQATGGSTYSRLQDWTAADRVNDRIVRFRFSSPHPDYLSEVARWGMIDPAAFASVKNRGGGTGPFKVEEWVPGDHLTLTKFDNYWLPGIPAIDRIIMRPYADPAAMENAFRAGTIDIAHTIPNKDTPLLRNAGLTVIPAPVANEFYILTLNARRPPLNNLQVRQAFQHLVDRAAIVKTVLGGVGAPTVQIVAPGTAAYDPALNATYGFDLAKAKALLALGGVTRGFTPTLLASTVTPEVPQIAEIIQADLKKVGVDAHVDVVEGSTYYPRYFKGDFDLNLSFLTLATLDPTDFTVSSAFRTNATNPSWLEVGPPKVYIDGVRSLDETLDQAKRWQNLRALIRVILEQSWTVPIALHIPTFGVGKAVRGFAVDPQMIIDLRAVWLDR